MSTTVVHSQSQLPQEHGSEANADVILTGLTVAGLAVAIFDAFAMPLPPAAVLAALAVAYLAGGLPPLANALKELFGKGVLDIDLLMVVAAVAAAVVGAAMEGAVLLALFSIAGTLEHRAMGRARHAVEALMQLRPDTALRLGPDGAVTEVAVANLVPGDRVVLRPGARVPVDGKVVDGEGRLDEATVTGESHPMKKGPGAAVFEACVNLDSVLTIEVTRGLNDSTVARMIRLVTEAQAAKAPSERFSDWFGQTYTVAVLVGAILAYFGFRLFDYEPEHALYHAATLLVAASPCAVVISVPAAILSALSAAARGGVLFKGGAALERLAAVKSFAFDKTGTLTTGRAEVTGLQVADGDEHGFIALLAGLEAHSEHPIADAIRRAALARDLVPVLVTGVRALPSEGIVGSDALGEVWAGNDRLVQRMGATEAAQALAADHGEDTMVWLGRGAQVLGAVRVADAARETSAQALASLRKGGVRQIVMMTGDRRAVALRIGRDLGFADDDIASDLMAADKVKLVEKLSAEGAVAFVGDGVNDAAALARADVGIAMGAAGSEVALQAADVALMAEDMGQLADAHRLSRKAAAIIKQNLAFALGAMLVLVTGGLFFELPLPLAVIGHEGGTLLVVLNGLRLLADPIRKG
ncbi:cadmium-translocating P-type ATPase [Rhodobacter sp. Har01]|uniref:heavy metal translocating P-type ATPase n=1 Tax=Rhodobacter sp. Har01 TaxID=2883999 RepID=UPI001D068C8F|nr:cation-translocating P-type ATPase [Rhodobacter sp. Har01]MCB6176834.1 cadmium-translocating P-type ATPase [Rhodobacter sp. Har01]